MAENIISKHKTLRHFAALIFAVSSILPALLFLFVLDRYNLVQETEVVLILVLSLFVSGLGYLLFLQIIKQIRLLAEDFFKVKEGTLEQIVIRDVPQEITDMAHIAGGFNKILTGFKTNSKELETLIYKFSTLSELTELVSRTPNIKDVLKTVLHSTMITVKAKRGSIMLLDERKLVLAIEAAEGLEEDIMNNTSIPLGEGVPGKVAQTGQSVLVEDWEKDHRFDRTDNPKIETSSFLCMPLKIFERVIGVVNLSKKENGDAFTESELRFLKTLINHISLAVDYGRLLKEAKEDTSRFQETLVSG